MKRWLVIVLVVVVAVVVGVAGVFGGRASAGTPSPQEAAKVLSNLTAQQRQQLAQSGGLGGVFGGSRGTGNATGSGVGGFTSGSIVTSDSNSITVKLSDGSTKIVIYSPSTTISVSKTGSASDLTAGQDVSVTGTANSDGTITATRIQVGTLPRPAGSSTSSTGAGEQGTRGTTGSTGTTAATGSTTQ